MDTLIFGIHWFAFYVTYIDSFAVEHIPKEIKKFIKNKNKLKCF